MPNAGSTVRYRHFGASDNPVLTLTTRSCQNEIMTPKPIADEDQAKFQQLIKVRAAALDHFVKAVEYSKERRVLITELMDAGYSQSDIARQMGVSRQAVQKMLTLHRERTLLPRRRGHDK
jgi:DNA-directed RNA polymerase sigma subunit (sigma70/sigma32)